VPKSDAWVSDIASAIQRITALSPLSGAVTADSGIMSRRAAQAPSPDPAGGGAHLH
jgi:hypothetical protein